MSNIEQLEKLAELKNKGLITDEEFEAQKKALLFTPTSAPNGETKSSVAYVLLGFFLGVFGIHNFYAGRWKQGIGQLLLALTIIGLFANIIWVAVNLMATRLDGKGRPMRPQSATLGIILGVIMLLSPVVSCGAAPLVVGGIAGYTQAMTRYESNAIADYVSMCAVASMVREGSASTTCGALLDDVGTLPAELNASDFLVTTEYGKTVITTPALSKAVRQHIMTLGENLPIEEQGAKLRFIVN